MDFARRHLMQMTTLVGLMACAGLLREAQATAWNKSAFSAKTLDDVTKALGGHTPQKSEAILLRAPDIAENGALVSISIETALKATELAILVEKNPNTLAAIFTIPNGTEAFASTRIKMSETSNVYALAKVDGRWLMSVKEIKVTIGACGG
jgi:sulfur-oxidizing protein SoxY